MYFTTYSKSTKHVTTKHNITAYHNTSQHITTRTKPPIPPGLGLQEQVSRNSWLGLGLQVRVRVTTVQGGREGRGGVVQPQASSERGIIHEEGVKHICNPKRNPSRKEGPTLAVMHAVSACEKTV